MKVHKEQIKGQDVYFVHVDTTILWFTSDCKYGDFAKIGETDIISDVEELIRNQAEESINKLY